MAKRLLKPLKNKLWKIFSLYIKLLHSNHNGTANCYTCDKLLYIGHISCQAGHWLPKGTYQYHYFNPLQVRPQCSRCNNWALGNSEVFRRRLEIEIGSQALEDIYATRNKGGTRKAEWYDTQIDDYTEKLKRLQHK